VLVVDAANVIGSRPDGWWRDRAGAARRLLDGVEEALAARRLAGPVTVVLEGAARAAADHDTGGRPVGGLMVVAAPGSGDDAIVAVVAQSAGGPAAAGAVSVVTADRALRRRVEALGAAVVGPSWLLDRLGG
jgi:hypothetical protein